MTGEAVTTLPARRAASSRVGADAHSSLTESDRFPALDGLRAFAVLSVMVGHLVPITGLQKLVGWGDVGVVIFFCLSGFLITNILLRADDGSDRGLILKAFYARRFLRIFPIYYLAVAAAALLGYEPVRDNLARLLTYSLNVPGLGLSTDLGAASHLWSLSVEEQFYIIWPIVLLTVPRQYLKWTLAAIVASSVVYKMALALTGADYAAIFRPITGSADSLALGALVAVVRTEGVRVPVRLAVIGVVAAVIVTAYRMANPIDAFYTGALPFAVVQFLVIALASAAVIGFFVDSKSRVGDALGHPILEGIARISYGLYLYHFFVPLALSGLVGGPLLSLVSVVLTFALATVSWVVIERPLLSLKRWVPYGSRNRVGRLA
jgi:peptidoglycan/LPS O-acetylase OafA/YrhL